MISNFRKYIYCRSSRPEGFRWKGVTCNFIKRRLWRRCFPMNVAKFLRTPSLIEHFQWLLLLFWSHCRVLLTILQLTVSVVNWSQVLFLWIVQFNLEAALQTNRVIEYDVKKSSKSNLTMLLNVKMMKKHKWRKL